MADQTSGLLSPFLQRRRIGAALPHFGIGRILDVGCGGGALAAHIPPERYVGVDIDHDAIQVARRAHVRHCFFTMEEFEAAALPSFDVIVALAVIEHVPDPGGWLTRWSAHLAEGGRFVLTTPHPMFRKLHDVGAALGIFSREAAAEHQTLLDRASLIRASAAADLLPRCYRRFLYGANQLFTLEPAAPRLAP
jgi:2-polyprenyl-3-methyl-5-hydroxy-6-metoxy-1,4-benzoquinol methylase